MKRFFIILSAICAVFLFAACQNPTGADVAAPTVSGSVAIQTTDGIRYVKNSLWEGCSLAYLTAKSSGRSADATISADDLTAIVEGLNDTSTDTQYFVSEEDIPVEESPKINIYIVKKNSHEIILEYPDHDRSDFKENYRSFQLSCQMQGNGAEMYIDKIPPAYIPPVDDRPNSIKHLIYIIDRTDGSIYYQEISDNTVPDDYTKSLDDWFGERVLGMNSWAYSLGGARYYVFSGDVYTVPVPEDPETPATD